jgi:hypothetical protein
VAKLREEWLLELARKITPRIEEVSGQTMPPFRISVGFPTRGALSLKRRVIGQCWPGLMSKDKHHEIFISPLIADELEVAATVAHELVHANVGTAAGHRKPFTRVAYGIGLAGKPTATVAGDGFKDFVMPVLKKIGGFGHAGLTPSTDSRFKPQTTRLLKAACLKCQYTVRVTAKWVNEAGAPICPTHVKPMHVFGIGK